MEQVLLYVEMDKIIFVVVCWGCALIFGAIALWAFIRKTPMHFWAGSTVSPQEISDIAAYNRANSKMWAAYAALTFVTGMISLFNILAATVLLIVIFFPGIVILFKVYNRIYRKYGNIK